MDYLLHILIVVGIYALLVSALNLIAGYCGFLSIAHAAFFGVGAYTTALLALRVGSPFVLCALASACAGALLGAVVALPALRLRGDYFVIASFGLQIVASSVMNNCVSLTGGPMGLPGIPQPVVLGVAISSHWGFLTLVVVINAILFLLWRRIVAAPFGATLRAIREDERFVEAVGKNVPWYKLRAFALSAAVASVAGSLYAAYFTFVDPSSFTVMESIFVVSALVLGGAGSLWGPVVGAAVLVSLPEALRLIGLPASVAANLRQVIYGAVLVVMMMLRPKGVLGKYSFGR
jgi:branched-chain amino acid transport system permease protein